MCAGKLLSLIKKCLHREKNSYKSEHGAPAAGAGSRKRGSPRPPVACCAICQQQQQQQQQQLQHTQQQQQQQPGYHRLCPSPITEHSHHLQQQQQTCHCLMGSGCYVGTPVAYMPGMPMDHIDQEVALQRERQLRFHAVQTDMELNLPPAIRISKDGEEGYVPSQRLLQLSWTADRRRESICPPPNKTVYQGDSPPPYRAVSKMEGKRSSSGAGGHLLANKLGCGTNSSPRISSSHCSSGDKRLHAYAGQHGSHGRLTPCMPSVQPCCHHSCHGQHGSQLPISHLSQSLHSPKLRLGASPPANTNPSTSSTMAPYAHQDSHMHGTACHGNSCHNGTGHQGPHRKPTTVAQHGYYGPPPDYTEVVPGGATINKPTTATAAQPQQQQPVQTDSQV